MRPSPLRVFVVRARPHSPRRREDAKKGFQAWGKFHDVSENQRGYRDSKRGSDHLVSEEQLFQRRIHAFQAHPRVSDAKRGRSPQGDRALFQEPATQPRKHRPRHPARRCHHSSPGLAAGGRRQPQAGCAVSGSVVRADGGGKILFRLCGHRGRAARQEASGAARDGPEIRARCASGGAGSSGNTAGYRLSGVRGAGEFVLAQANRHRRQDLPSR